MKTVVVIPARYKSSRFPGKPLASINGKPMIQWVWESAIQAIDKESVYVATDDERIADCVVEFGGRVQMTPDHCETGTDRIYEFSKSVSADLYVNVQGDEPLIDHLDIQNFIRHSLENPSVILNGYAPIDSDEEYRSLSVPKVAVSTLGDLLYMSRSPIPGNKTDTFVSARKQVCIYSFPSALLRRFGEHQQKTPLEQQEDIEILRFVELCMPVKMIECKAGTIAVDFPEDVAKVEKYIDEH